MMDITICAALLGTAAYIALHPVQKLENILKTDLTRLVSESVGPWRGITYDVSDIIDKTEFLNDLMAREYRRDNPFSLRSPTSRVSFILEYSSDLRRNFSFHFPERCHRAHGNEIQFLESAEIELGDGKVIMAKRLFIKGMPTSSEKKDKIVLYWLVMGGKHYHDTFYVKLDQMLSGLLSRAKSGFLVRIDYSDGFEYTPEGLDKASRVSAGFIKDLYEASGSQTRGMIFGEELAK